MPNSKNQTSSLREKFKAACMGSAMWNRYERDLQRMHEGTIDDFQACFDRIAADLKPALEQLICDIESGKSVIKVMGESYRHFGPPLKLEIVIPASCEGALADKIMDTFYYLSGYRRIHEICMGKDVDMNVITVRKSSSYFTPDGRSVSYNSILIEIEPESGYRNRSDYKPSSLPPAPKPGFPPSGLS